jgi:NDP-sugar pyrophosphorylase family protein
VLPKPLMPVGGIPILEVIIRQLARDGASDVTITLGYLGRLIRMYFGDGSEFGVRITYSEESTPLGTMGPLRLIADLPRDFLVLNGDVLTDLSYSMFFERHCREGHLFSISSHKREVLSDFGVLETNTAGELVGFREKPRLPFEVSMGVYAINREVLQDIPPEQPFGFDQLMLKFLAEGKRPHVYRHDGVWLDIGRVDDFDRAQVVFQEMRERLLGPYE